MNNIKRLPDSYVKAKEGNHYKLMAIQEQSRKEIKQDIQDLEDMLDINLAYGKTLDLYGEMVSQKRGLLDDIQYRYMIFTKIGKNIVGGDYNSIMGSIITMFNCKNGTIALDDVGLDESGQPCVLKLTKFPLHVLINAGFSSRQSIAMIESLLPTCVTLAADNFEGTFEFSELDNDYNKTAGFSDTDNKIGGYFGLLLGEDDTDSPSNIRKDE